MGLPILWAALVRQDLAPIVELDANSKYYSVVYFQHFSLKWCNLQNIIRPDSMILSFQYPPKKIYSIEGLRKRISAFTKVKISFFYQSFSLWAELTNWNHQQWYKMLMNITVNASTKWIWLYWRQAECLVPQLVYFCQLRTSHETEIISCMSSSLPLKIKKRLTL